MRLKNFQRGVENMKRNILAAVIAFLLFIPMPLNVIPVKASCSQYVQDMIFSADFNENPNAIIELSPGDNADYGLYYLQRTQTTVELSGWIRFPKVLVQRKLPSI